MRATILFVTAMTAAAAALAQCPPPGPSNWCSGTYQYDGVGNIKAIGADMYTYDPMGRLVRGTADYQRTGVWSRQNYTYDPAGNRLTATREFGSVGCLGGCEISPLVISQSSNHITSNNALYDEAGNLIRIDSATYSYDAAGSLNRSISGSDDRQYVYTADDERIATRNGLSWTWTLRGLDNKVLREFTSLESGGVPTSNRQWAKDYVWRNGLLLASVAPTTPGAATTVVRHFHLDHLGTPRVVTNASGMPIGFHAYYPFGTELNITPHEPNEERMKFTGHERDILANDPHTLDAMHARYEMATLGRFMSVDPGKDWHADRPQTWNRYAYTRNNPLSNVDPNGKWSKEIHESLLTQAFPGLTRGELSTLKAASKKVDSIFTGQWSQGSYAHAMRASWQTVDQANALSAEFYNKNVETARKRNGVGSPKLQDKLESVSHYESLFAAGKAMHMVSDSLSPEHRGAQVWSPLAHPFKSTLEHPAGEAVIDPKTEQLAITYLRVVFQTIYGDEELKRAMTPPPAGACISGQPACR